MTKCKFHKEWKKPAIIMGPICGYCKRHKKKTSGYYGNYMRVLQEMLNNPTKTMDPYAGIARNVKQLNENHGPICGYCNEWRMSTTMGGPYAGIARDAKNTSGYYGT